MSNVECPSQAWDRHIAGEEDAADAAMAMEEEVLKEVGEPALSFFHTLPENVLSDIIQTAHKKGYAQAGKDRIDAKSVYEFEQLCMTLCSPGQSFVPCTAKRQNLLKQPCG